MRIAKQLTAIAIDWLQLHCKIATEDKRCAWARGVYEVERRPYGTQFFEDVWYFTENKRLIATVCCTPRASTLAADTAIVKFENDLLYQGGLRQFVETFLSLNNLEFIGITRLDVAVDFNRFANGWNGEQLIEKYLQKKIVKMGRGTWNAIGRNERYLIGETLKFGGKDSPIKVYLYNKTREQEKKKYKPWIVDHWDATGLNLTEDVWRLEVSIRGARKQLEMVSTGSPDGTQSKSVVDFYSLEIIDQVRILWETLVKKYFQFAKDNPKEKNKGRLKKLHLFDGMVHRAAIIERTDKKTSTHMEKAFCNWLDRTAMELRGTADDIAQYFRDAKDWFVYSRDLDRQRQLARDKIIGANPDAGRFAVATEIIDNKVTVVPKAWQSTIDFNFDE